MGNKDKSQLQFYIDSASISHKMADAIKKELNRELNIYHVRYRHWLVLKSIHFEEAITPAKIATLMCVDKSSLSRILDHLVLHALVKRNRETVDRRITTLVLTERGIHVVNAGLKRLPKANQCFKKTLSGHELEVLNYIEKKYNDRYSS